MNNCLRNDLTDSTSKTNNTSNDTDNNRINSLHNSTHHTINNKAYDDDNNNIKVVVAIDSLKGSLTSLEAGYAIRDGINKALPQAIVDVRPLADGGEGTSDALIACSGATHRDVLVTGPIGGSKVTASYGINQSEGLAIIDIASASGITLVASDDRNPLTATTYGTGELILDALRLGCKKFLIGLGGSATNDGGAGMLQALGFDLLDSNGKQIPQGASGLALLASVSNTNVDKSLLDCEFRVACDVNNPLCGNNGCSAVFGPQKGATPEMVADMDRWLSSYAKIVKSEYADKPGSGAAGGLGFAFLTFLNASLEPGIEIVIDETHLEEFIAGTDIVVTGEGRLDAQTVMGKAPIGVAKIAKKHGKTVIAFAGSVTDDATICNLHGIDAFFPIVRGITTLDEAMDTKTAYKNLSATAEQVFRVIDASWSHN